MPNLDNHVEHVAENKNSEGEAEVGFTLFDMMYAYG